MDIKEILKHVDHTLLLQGSTWEEIKQICDHGLISNWENGNTKGIS